ncbi:MAG: enolase [Candidatus Bathyarchaeota archaeon B23]|nr:MAG: enolase [Candidatus Bathyarchaeota archaeon B23]
MGRYSITRVRAREVLDSRGNPTVEVEVETEGGAHGMASVPSGASWGRHEAVELRDGDRRFHGMGVLKAVSNVVEVIAPRLRGLDVREQRVIDELMIELDGTGNKARLGANAVLAVSIACAKAAAASLGLQLYEYVGGLDADLMPIPFLNVINGGRHAGNELDFQEFMIAPVGAESFREALRMGSEVYHELRRLLIERYGRSAINVGDEGGFSPPMRRAEEALEAILWAVEELGYSRVVSPALDSAASTLYGPEGYRIAGGLLSRGELLDYYEELVRVYHIISIEDPFQEEDFEGFAEATRLLGIQVVGDDLFATNVERLRRGIDMGAANALLWKVNQVGTLTEALEAAELAMSSGYGVMASHRSGETEDPFVADLSVALGCGQIKAGAPCRGERTAKYNRLLRIEERLGGRARYPRGLPRRL